jgi:hypothetical protein
VATVHKSNFPITLEAIRSALGVKFEAVPLDNVPAETVIQIGRSLEDNQATYDAILAGVRAAGSSGARWVSVVLANLAPGVVDMAAARMIKSGELTLEGLSRCEIVYGVFPITSVIMAIIDRDFHASYSDATGRLTRQLRDALQLDDMGVPNLVATDLRIRTLLGTHAHNQELVSYNGITESLAQLVVSADKLHPIAMYPRLQGDWLNIYDHATCILEERSEDKVKQFDEARFYEMSDRLQALARGILTIQSRRDLAGERDGSHARAVSQVSAAPLAIPPSKGWDEDEEPYYTRAEWEVYTATAAGGTGDGPRAETIPCEFGCGQAMRRDAPWCPGCGGHKPGSWVCRCLRVNASSDELCRNRT